jgi:hypothetical protein
MKDVIEQLEQVRTRARVLLLARRVMQLIAAILVSLLVAGVVDYLLRLPGWMRLLILLLASATGLWWTITRFSKAIGFRPALGTLALRAERMYPQLAGVLASGVEFAANPDDYADPKRTASLAKASIDQVKQRMGTASLNSLVNKSPTMRTLAIVLLVLLVTAGVTFASPASASLALQRWLLPLSDTHWPKRTMMTSLVTNTIAPIDTPVRLRAAIDKGFSTGMRTWAHYSVADVDGQFRTWYKVLMSEQHSSASPNASATQTKSGANDSATISNKTSPVKSSKSGVFERLIDLDSELSDRADHVAVSFAGVAMQFFFEAGDDQSTPQQITLVPRPAIESFRVEITPPVYANNLVEPEVFVLHQQAGRVAVATGLIGSTVKMHLTLNKPVTNIHINTPNNTPKHATGDAKDQAELVLSFKLTESFETPVTLIDEHGLENLSDRIYRIEAQTDRLPTVSVIDPPADESVLATAVIPVAGLARDDVGIDTLTLEAQIPNRTSEASRQPTDVKSTAGNNQTTILAVTDNKQAREQRVSANHQLKLIELALKPGDQVTLTAVARDVFQLEGKRHEAVRSSPRTLHIVDSATLTEQLRNDLGSLRQQAIRLERRQQDIIDQQSKQAITQQQQMSQSLTRQQEALKRLQQRVGRNQLNDPQLQQLIDRSTKHINRATDASKNAAQQLQKAKQPSETGESKKAQNQAKENATVQQAQAAKSLRELIEELDQGKDALSVQLQLRQLEQAQNALAGKTREMLSKTAGANREQLPENQKKQLDGLSKQQDRLAKQAQDLIRQMKSTAETIQNNAKNPREKATAHALSEAAATAQREGLQQQMKKASSDAKENKLASASQQQSQASQTLKQMMKQMQTGQQEKQQAMLRRLLVKLEASIQKLIEQQKAHLARVEEAKQLLPLAESLVLLRRNTMSISIEAQSSDKTAALAKYLDSAANSQAAAIVHLRSDAQQQDEAIQAEQAALASLLEAAEQIKKMQAKEQEKETDKERDELKAEYEKLAKIQAALQDRTKKLVEVEQLNRRQKAELFQIGHEETDLNVEAGKLQEKVSKTLVFQHLHKQIDQAAKRITEKLGLVQADQQVLMDQASITRNLQLMAKALDEAKKNESPFDKPKANQGSGNGSGKQAGGAKPPLVPKISELKLLRGLQESVYKQTRNLDETGEGLTASQRVGTLENLANQQADLNDLGTNLIKQLSNQSQQIKPKQVETPGLKPKTDKDRP